jgi:hypothetical protein
LSLKEKGGIFFLKEAKVCVEKYGKVICLSKKGVAKA